MKRQFSSFAALAALILAFVAGALFSNLVSAQSQMTVRQVLREDLNGLDGQEVVMQEIVFPSGSGTPLHTHPDGHEISFVVEGTPTLEVEGKATQLKPGDGFHIQPGVVHRGFNESGAPVKLLIVRVNTKGKPLMVPVQK